MGIPPPLHSPAWEPYWYVTTPNMIRSSEIIAEEYLSGSGYPQDPLPEEAFFTSFLEGSPMSLEDGIGV